MSGRWPNTVSRRTAVRRPANQLLLRCPEEAGFRRSPACAVGWAPFGRTTTCARSGTFQSPAFHPVTAPGLTPSTQR